jgi:hypothetical protein
MALASVYHVWNAGRRRRDWVWIHLKRYALILVVVKLSLAFVQIKEILTTKQGLSDPTISLCGIDQLSYKPELAA